MRKLIYTDSKSFLPLFSFLLLFLLGLSSPQAASAAADKGRALPEDFYCATPSGLYTTNITSTGAQVGWSYVSGAAFYYLQYRPANSNNWTTVQANTNSYYLGGLQPGTQYFFQVASRCYNGETSGYSYSSNFYTQGGYNCEIPTWLMSTNITCYSAHLSWDIMVGAANYTIQWKSEYDYDWTSIVTVNTNYLDLLSLQPNTWYQWRIRANCANGGASGWSAVQTFGTPYCQGCNAPGNLSVYNIGLNNATLSWSPVSNASYYTLQYRTVGAPYNQWSSLTVYGTTQVLSNLWANTSYEWRVQTNCYNGSVSSWSYISNFTTLYVNCTPPSWLNTINIQCNMARASWDPIPGVTSYYIQWKEAGSNYWTYSGTTTGSFFDMMNLSNNTAYVWRVRSNCGNGNQSQYSENVYFTTACQTCYVPGNLTATNITNNSAQLGWSAVPGANSYTVQYAVWNSNNWTTVTAFTNWYSLYNLQPNTTYVFRVSANCNGGSSAYSNNYTFNTGYYNSCPVPTWLMENNITSNSVLLTWDPMPGACSYTVEYRATGSNNWITTTVYNAQLYITQLQPGTQYQWHVRTNCCNSAYSDWSTLRYFTTGGSQYCDAPTGLNAYNITGNSATLSWNPVAGVSVYQLRYKAVNSNNWITVTVNGTSYNLNNLLSNTNYWWQVRACCPNGLYSPYFYEANFTTGGYQYCDAPTGLSSYNITGSSATLSWNPVPGVSLYQLRYKAVNSNNWVTVTVNGTSYNLTNLLNNTNYWWQVRACCPNGIYSPYSYEANFTTGGYWCQTPSWLTETNVSNTSATLNWDPVQNAASYFLQWRVANTTNWQGGVTVNGNSYTLYSLSPNTSYEWRVRTNCYNGDYSEYSWPEFFTTGGSVTCAIPSYLYANNITGNSAVVGWTAVPGAVSYTVEYMVSGSNMPLTVTTANSAVVLYNLSPGTSYTFRVRTNCANGYSSAYSYMLWFTTTGGYCSAPYNTNESNITYNTATLTWSAVNGAYNYTLQWRVLGAPNWEQMFVPNNYVTLATLQANTTYQWRVRTNCGNGYNSDYSATDQFTTSNSSGQVSNDNPCGAIPVPTSTMCNPTGGNNIGATNTTTPPPPPGCAYNGGDVWYVTTVPASGMVTILTSAGSLNDIVLALYTGSCNSLTYVTCVDDYEGSTMPSVMYTGTPGTILYIRVWGYNGAQGSYNICASSMPQDLQAEEVDLTEDNAVDQIAIDRAPETGLDLRINPIPEHLFNCYPNPTQGNLTIEIPSDNWQNSTITILDAQGKMLREVRPADRSTSISLDQYGAGMYFIRLDARETSEVRKIVLLK